MQLEEATELIQGDPPLCEVVSCNAEGLTTVSTSMQLARNVRLGSENESTERKGLSCRLLAAAASVTAAKVKSVVLEPCIDLQINDDHVIFSTPLKQGTGIAKDRDAEDNQALGGMRDTFRTIDKLPFAASVGQRLRGKIHTVILENPHWMRQGH